MRRRVRRRKGRHELLVDAALLDAVAVDDVVLEVVAELRLRPGQRDAVLRALRPGDGRHDRRQVELEVLRVAGLGLVGTGVQPHALLLGIRLHESHGLVGASGEAQVVEGDVVDREDRARRTELRAHVADRGAVRQRHLRDALTVELDELADDSVVAQHLGDRQHDVGGGRPGGDRARQLEPDDPRDEHRDRLAEHGRLGLDAADTPAEDAQAVDHRCMRVGADAGVGVCDSVPVEDDPGKVLDVDLVDDAGAGRDDLEVVESGLAPPEELVALAVAVVLDLDVALEGVRAAEDVDDDRVVDDHLGGRQGVDLGGFAAEVGHRLAHRGEVDDAGDAGEVLHENARRRELDLDARFGVRVPVPQRADVVRRDVGAVLGAQQVLQQHLEAVREVLAALDRAQPVDLVVRLADLEPTLCTERVDRAVHPASSLNSNYLDVKISHHPGVRQCDVTAI